MADFDAAVIGAGACGLACAAELAPFGSLLLVERENGIGRGASSRNSEVLHAGLYYPPGSLKARLCLEGARWIRARADHIPQRACGKLVLATAEGDLPRLERLEHNARTCGVANLHRLTGEDAQRRVPEVRCLAALWSPDTAILDSHALLAWQWQRARSSGAEGVFQHRLVSARRAGREWVLGLEGPEGPVELSCDRVVNAAGLYSDRVAALAGQDTDTPDLRLHWNRGEYYTWHPRQPVHIPHLLYPVPGSGDGHLGVHLTLDLGGGLRFGPTSSPEVETVERYDIGPGGLQAVADSVSRWLPAVQAADLEPGLVGLRARLAAPGQPARDFHIAGESQHGLPGWLDLIGIESPGLTASPAIGKLAATLLGFPPD